MIKVKKYISLLIIFFLFLSDIAFAQNSGSDSGHGDMSGGGGIETSSGFSGEGTVNPKVISTGSIIDLYIKGEVSEDDLRKLEKEKMGDKFDDVQFKKNLMDMADRMKRKDTFSFQNDGIAHKYDAGPSYGGYSKEQIIFGLIFEQVGDDIGPREIKQYCNDTSKIADIIISKLKDNVGDIQKLCSKFEERESKCHDESMKMCSQIGIPVMTNNANEMEKIKSVAFSCPVNKDAIIESCKLRGKSYLEQQIKNVDASCEKKSGFDKQRMGRECEKLKQYQVCDKDKYMQQCISNAGVSKEDFDENGKRKAVCPKYPVPSCEEDMKLETKSDSNGCRYYYCVQVNQCPTQASPTCKEGETLQKKSDGRGCIYYYCQSNPEMNSTTRTATCQESAMPTCSSSQTLQKKIDDKGCVYYYCETSSATAATTTSRPSKITMESSDGTWCYDSDGNGGYFTKGYCQDNSGTYNDFCDGDTARDYYCTGTWNGAAWSKVRCENGGYVCSSGNYKCSDGACIQAQTTPACPSPQKPTCNSDETIQAYYDNAGCVTSYQCVKQQTNTTSSNSSPITGQAVSETYNDYQAKCESNWVQQEKICQNMQSSCDSSNFVEICKEQSLKNYNDLKSRIDANCQSQTISQIKSAEDRCSRIGDERKKCSEETAQRCEQMKGLKDKCAEILTEDNLRKFIVQEADKRCKFTNLVQNEEDVKKADKAEIVLAVLNTATDNDIEKLKLFIENLQEDLKLRDATVYKGTIDPNRFGDIKLLPFVVNAKLNVPSSSEKSKNVKENLVSKQKAEDVASKLISLRDSDVPKEYLYIIEDKANDVLNASGQVGEIQKNEEQKGFGYKMKLFLGLAKKAEQQEINQLQSSKDKLQNSIETLTKLVDEVPNDVAKSILKEQVESLKKQQADIEILIQAKEKKAKGFFGLFG